MANDQNLKPFMEDDPRINRGGRPRNLSIIKSLAREVSYEQADLSRDTLSCTRVEAIIRDWLTSTDYRKQRAALEFAFGRIPRHERIEHETDRIIIDWDGTATPVAHPGSAGKHRSQTIRLRSAAYWLHRRSLI